MLQREIKLCRLMTTTNYKYRKRAELILFMISPLADHLAQSVVFATATSFIGTYYFWMIEGTNDSCSWCLATPQINFDILFFFAGRLYMMLTE